MAAISTMLAAATLGIGAASYVGNKQANKRAVKTQKANNKALITNQNRTQQKQEDAAREAMRLKSSKVSPEAAVKLGSEDGIDTKTKTSSRKKGTSRSTTSPLGSAWTAGNKLIGGL